MTTYKHSKTGALIEISGVISGGYWVPVEPENQEETVPDEMKIIHMEKATNSEETLTNFEDVDLDAMTIEELKAFAKTNQIEINLKAKKNDLIEAIAAVIY